MINKRFGLTQLYPKKRIEHNEKIYQRELTIQVMGQ